MKAGLFLAVFGLFWTLIVGVFDVLVGHAIYRQSVATGYPSVVGRVTRSEVTRHSGSKGGSTYGARIEYAYRVGREEHQGERIRHGEFNSSDSDWAQAAVAAHPVGKEVPVYYNPNDPTDALLTPGLDGSDLMQLLFLTPFNLVMLGLWTAGGSGLWHGWRKTPAGGVRLRTNRRQTQICLAAFGPLAAGGVAMGVSAFASIFVVGFGLGGFHPRLGVMLTVWAVVLGIGISAALWQWRRIRSGRYDLVLDDSAGWLEFPRSEDGAPVRRVPFTAAKRLEVEAVVERTAKGGRTITYFPVLHLRPGHGESVRLGKFHLESRAQAFADWLGQKLGLKEASLDR